MPRRRPCRATGGNALHKSDQIVNMATAPLGGPVLQWVKDNDNEPVLRPSATKMRATVFSDQLVKPQSRLFRQGIIKVGPSAVARRAEGRQWAKQLTAL
jgi:hypothetical protein